MELQTKKKGSVLLVSTKGRLDANWSEYFTDAFLGFIRKGEHHLVIDATLMHFLSSAGIRALIRIYKELNKVNGKFLIIHANKFVTDTLRMTGLGEWLDDTIPDDFAPAKTTTREHKLPENCFILEEKASLTLKTVNNWKPWQKISPSQIIRLQFPLNSFALGIGIPPEGNEASETQYGDFLAVGGNVVYQPPKEANLPDYMLPLENFVPEMLTIQAIYLRGGMRYLLRFHPGDSMQYKSVSDLATAALSISGTDMSAFVIIGEAGGLVGASMIRSPENEKTETITHYPHMRDWLSFTGERAFTGELALIFGVAANKNTVDHSMPLKSLPSKPGIMAHMHAVVFPYQPLPNGKIDLARQIEKIFNGPPPRAFLHLIDDNRPLQGLGESTFIRGALWCAPLNRREEEL